MGERSEILSVVDYQGDPSWRYDPSWVEYVFDKLGVEAGKDEMRRQFEIGLQNAVRTYRLLKADAALADTDRKDGE